MRIKNIGKRGLVASGGLFALVLMATGAWAQDIKPVDPQPSDDQLRPGLAVKYYYQFVRHIDELIEWEQHREGKPGEPLIELDSRVGEGDVLTSARDNGVGAKITGLIRLDKAGEYKFAFESNDGVRLEIGGEMILEDPDVHSDRFSELGSVVVEKPGWYPILIRYFERKSTSTLIFFWLPPGEKGTMPLVPPEALAHLPE